MSINFHSTSAQSDTLSKTFEKVRFKLQAHPTTTAASTDDDPHPLGIGPEARVEKVVRNLHVRDVRLVQFEAEPARGEDGGEGEVELAVCEAGRETFGQYISLHRHQAVGKGRGWV